jgi:hypothetical protein
MMAMACCRYELAASICKALNLISVVYLELTLWTEARGRRKITQHRLCASCGYS